MNEIIRKFSLATDKLMPEMRLKQTGFAFRACGPFTKNKEIIQKFKETGYSRCIYQTELNKGCVRDDMAYGNSKDKAFNIAKNHIKEALLQWLTNFSIKSPVLVVLNMKLCQTSVLWT